MTDWRYTKGLHHLGGGSHAYLLPDGGWGWSNAGLVVDSDQSMLIDTLFDLNMTSEMLTTMADAVPTAKQIDILVNSHADGDHTFGNELVGGARIVASSGTAGEFFNLGPDRLHSIIMNADSLGEGAQFIRDHMGPGRFDFGNITLTAPTETYDRQTSLKVGDKDVLLTNVGPAHTRGDTLVQVVQDRVVYTGDILFLGVHPAIWDGNVDGWIRACDRILEMDVDVVVPGHGPITDKAGVRLFQSYLVMIRSEARKRFEAGMGVEEAAQDIVFSPPYADWVSPERVAGCVNYLFLQWGAKDATTDVLERFAMINRYAKAKAAKPSKTAAAVCDHPH